MITHPHPFYEVTCSRDDAVLFFHQTNTRIVILWDEDCDARIVQVAVALCYRSPDEFPRLLALGEHRGEIVAWIDAATPDPNRFREALQGAADVATAKSWRVATVSSIRCRNGSADRPTIPPGHPLHAASRRCAFGRVVRA